MQIRIRCYNCFTPFAMRPEEVEAALAEVTTQGLKYANALCPKCGRTNKVSEKQLRAAAPHWTPTVATAPEPSGALNAATHSSKGEEKMATRKTKKGSKKASSKRKTTKRKSAAKKRKR